MSISPHTSSRRGFTLIELLVVVAIIAILAAILFPVFGTARERARQTACLSNLKQIGLGLMQYSQDYDERFPAWKSGYSVSPAEPESVDKLWKSRVHPYIKGGNATSQTVGGVLYAEDGVWRCPSIDRWKENVGGIRPATASYGMSMAMAYKRYPTDKSGTPAAPNTRYYRGLALADLRAPSETIFAGDGGFDGRLDTPLNFRWRFYNTTFATTGAPYVQHWERRVAHNGGSNYLFADGHAKWLKAEVAYPDGSALAAAPAAIRYHAATQLDYDELLKLYPSAVTP